MEKEENNSGDRLESNPSGLRENFGMIYSQYLPRVFRYVSYKVGNISIAEDLTSNVFEKALVSYGRYCSEKASISTWLFAIARHTIADYYKMNRRRQNVPLDLLSDSNTENDPVDAITQKEDVNRLSTLLSRLSQREQDIISLKFAAELTNRQIAEMLNLSETNVGVIIHRAVRKLRVDFRGWQDE